MKPETLITHFNKEAQLYDIVNDPIYMASTVLFSTYSEFKKSWQGTHTGITYGRHGSPAKKALEKALAKLEDADKCLVTNSGVSAISVVLLSFLKPRDHLLVTDSVYAPTRIFCDTELKKFGVEVSYYNPTIGAGIKHLIKKNTKIIYIETPGSLTLEVQDIAAISKVAHKAKVLIVADNTWATPLFFKPFSKGIDISIHSATKYIAGHSDLLMGVINCKANLFAAINRTYKNLGICVGALEIYLAGRGLRTLAVRLNYQQDSAIKIAKFLEKHPKISSVNHPALPSHPQHKIWKKNFTGSSGLFGFSLKRALKESEYSKMLDEMKLFKMGYSWGGFESLIIPFELSKVRSFQPKNNLANFRISVGLENTQDLILDLEQALSRI